MRIIVALMIMLAPKAVQSQTCTLEICNKDACGSVFATYSASGQNVFCEGSLITLANTSSTKDFQVFYIDWGDGSKDTVRNYNNISHTYNYSGKIDRCKAGPFFNQTICWVGSKSCQDGESCNWGSTVITVKLKPVALFNAPEEVCINSSVTFSNSSCNVDPNGYLWDFGDGQTSTLSKPSHTYQTPGNYTVRLTVTNSCGSDTKTQSIRVVGIPDAEFTHSPEFGCGPTVVEFKNQSSQWSNTQWEITPNDTLRWRFTDTIMRLSSRDITVRFFQPGKYLVRLTAINACPVTDHKEVEINIYQQPGVFIESPGSFCDSKTINPADVRLKTTGEITSYQWTFENGSPGSFSGKDFPPVTFTKSGFIAVKVESPCGLAVDTALINIASTVPVSLDGNRTEFCQNEPPQHLKASPEGGTWLINGLANPALDAKGLLSPSMLKPGRYTLTYSAGSAQCPNEKQIAIQIKDSIAIQLQAEPAACEQLSYVPKVTYFGDISRYAWTFSGGNPASSDASRPTAIQFNTPGQKLVTVSAEGACGVARDTILIDIQQKENPTIQGFSAPLCSGSSPDTLKVNLSGGQWDGKGITDKQLGIFDPKTVAPGTYSITYTRKNGVCTATASTEVQVVSSESVTIRPDTFCINSTPRTIRVDKSGGLFFGAGVDSLSGLFSPSISGTGTWEVAYRKKDANNCQIDVKTQIEVEPLPVFQLPDTVELCLSNLDADLPKLLNYVPLPAGGISSWSGSGIKSATTGLFNASGLSIGFYPIRVAYQRNDCHTVDSLVVRLIEAQPLKLSPDTTVCVSDGIYQLNTNLKGGKWLPGPGMDPATGQIDLAKAGGGEFTYTYVFQEGTNCEQRGMVKLTIIDLSNDITPGPNQAICAGQPTFQLPKGTPAGGFFRGPALIDSIQGLLDLRLLQKDTSYTFQYCLQSSALVGCQACKTQTFRINSNPSASFEFIGTPCIDQPFQMRNTSQQAVTYFWNFGDGAISGSFEPRHSYQQKGNYSLSLVAVSSENCADTVSRNLYITTPPTVAFTIPRREGCAPFQLELQNQSSGDSISQSWIIGRDTFQGPNPGRITLDSITQDTFFRVELIVRNLCGEVRLLDSVLVHPYPIVNFGISQDEGCSPSKVELSNTSLGNPQNWSWDMGNGNRYMLANPPAQEYLTGEDYISEYKITLRASNQCGQDSLSKMVTVYPPNVKAFIEQDTFSACQPFQYRPKSFSTPGAVISWKIIHESGKITGSEKPAPTFLLGLPGRYTIILFASNCGTDTDTAYLNILPAPQADFQHRPFICMGQPLQFVNVSRDISGSQWTFGDGSPVSTLTSPVQVYDTAGVYWVHLKVFSAVNNCPAEDSSQVLVIGNPVASFQADQTSGCFPLNVRFTNQSAGNGVLTHVWDFGDGSSASNEINPIHRFLKPGNFVVRLTVFDRDSCFADTSLLNIFVHDRPDAQFAIAEKAFCLGYDSVTLSNQTKDAVQFWWNFQNDSSRLRNPVFWPRQAGDFPIQLIAQNQYNCADTLVQSIRILESPIAQIDSANFSGCEDLSVRFGNKSRFATGYLWQFDGNTSTSFAPGHTFRQAGAYVVHLAASSANGCPTDRDSVTVQVWPKPKAGFDFQKSAACGTPATVSFTNQSLGATGFLWQYGDGQQSARNQDTHLYQSPGLYQVILVAENEFGCSDTLVQGLDIFGQPVADFEVSPPVGCAPATVDLINKSESSLRYVWNVSRSGIFNQTNPVLSINDPGVYDVTLVAIYNDQCRDTITRRNAIRLYQGPSADFSYQANLDPKLLGDVQFTNRSRQADRYLWRFGDGQQSTARDPFHEYSINRTIQVTLIAYNDNQGQYLCADSITKPIEPEWLSRFYAPNALTPGYGDPRIQVFKPTGVGIKHYEIRVYSPQGQIIWFAEEENQPTPTAFWDGTYQGAVVPQGAYAWIAHVTFEDGSKRVYKGTVTVLR